MKLEGETALLHSNLVQNPKSKSFHHSGSTTDAGEQKSFKETLKKCEDDELFCDAQCNKKAFPLAIDDNDIGVLWPVSRFGHSESVISIKGGNENGSTDSTVTSIDSFGETESLKEEVDLFTDKNMTQCELPEVKHCRREHADPDVRDICVDDSQPPEKILFQTCSNSGFETPSSVEKNVDCNLAEENSKTNILSVDVEDNSVDKLSKQYGSIHPVRNNASPVMVTDDVSVGKSVPLVQMLSPENQSPVMVTDDVSIGKSVPLVRMLSPENQHEDYGDAAVNDIKVCHELVAESSGSSCASEEIERSYKSLVSASPSTEFMDEKQIDSVANIPKSHEAESGGPNEEATKEKPLLTKQSSDDDNTNTISYSSRMDSGSTAFNFDALAPLSHGREEENPNPHNGDGETYQQSMSKEDEVCDSRSDSYRYQNSHGETSFSMAGPFSGSITYAGPVAYSGSLSLRSEGSAASTGSFAFPTLQSEWNSSPVRMKKADRRYQKRGGCLCGFLCCKF